jgi:ferritin-like metal-binding protein YciE
VARDIQERLTKYLTDAHSIEEQALAQLRTAPDIAGDPQIASAFREHLAETEGHERMIRELLEARDAKPSRLKDTAMTIGGKGFLLFARLQPDTPGKLTAFAYAFEHLEIGGYEQPKRVAQRVGDEETVRMADTILEQERAAASKLAGAFNQAAAASLEAVGVA